MEKDSEMAPHQSRMEQDVQNTSRTMKPGEAQEKNLTPNNSATSTQSGGTSKGQGRGWHGNSEGHAKAGSQSHKKSNSKKQ